MRPLIGLAANAPLIAGRKRFLAASTLSWATPQVRPIAVEPGGRAVDADGARADDRPARRLELAQRGFVEWMDRRDRGAVERGIELAPFSRWHDRAGTEPERLEQRADADGVGREHLADEGDRRALAATLVGRRDGAGHHLLAGVGQHRTGEHVLGLGVRRDAEPRHVDADDAHAVDRLRKQPQRHAGCRRHAEIRHDDRVVMLGIGELVDRLADVLEQLAGDQRLGVERHVAHRTARTVEVRGECQAVDAAGRARQHRRGALHTQADAQRAERRAHALRLVVRALRIIGRVACQHFGIAGLGCGRPHLRLAAVAAGARRRDRLAGIRHADVGGVRLGAGCVVIHGHQTVS